MKRTVQAQIMVNSVNTYLMTNHIKNELDVTFTVFQFALLQAGIYEGFNYYTKEGKLSCGNPNTTDYIKFY